MKEGNMRYGVCATVESASILAAVGYDFIELHVQRDLKTTEPEDAFAPMVAQIQATAVPAIAANSFVPGGLKITGPDVDEEALEAYAATAFERAARSGLETIVFGSGGARQIPDDFDRDEAWQQLVRFGRLIGPLAEAQGVTVVVEPLNRRECNVLNLIGECAQYVREVDHPYVRLLVDAYHWGVENDSEEDLVEAMPLIRHAHIATYETRKAPGFEPCDFGPFFRALERGGYDGPLSIEARWSSLEDEAAKALATLREAASAAGVG
jgi:sugar phosphate isomerase/epimerase